ncbi:MAG: DUF177 domain-containing protein [Hyphomicrobiaceae bacterium]|nr:MAG: DUF177 domain-containing protein [Hyphomicrobiaceae bacterium]
MAKRSGKDPSSRRRQEDVDTAPSGLPLEAAPAVLAWEHKTTEIGPQGLQVERSATPAERKAVADLLDLVTVESLDASYRLKPGPGGLFTLQGRLEARLKQTCIVSLEEMSTSIDEPLSAEFWPGEQIPASGAALVDETEGEEPIAIRDGIIETGRLVYDVLALAVDPYPRKAEAELDWKGGDGPTEEAAPAPQSPFAALAELKKRGGEQP